MRNARLRYLAVLAAIWLGSCLVIRAALAVAAGTEPAGSWPARALAFLAGVVNDIPPFFLLTIPVFALVLLVPAKPATSWKTRLPRWIAGGLFAAYTAAFLFNLTAEWLFWDEFSSRYNFIAVDYLIYTHEVLGNIMESYPIWPLLGGIAAVSIALTLLSLRALRGLSFERPRLKYSLPLWGCAVVASLFFTPVLPTKDTITHELSANGVWELVSAFRNNQLNYRQFYPVIAEKDAFEHLRAELAEPATRFLTSAPGEWRRVVENPAPEKKLNVVQIVVESLGANALGENTPNLNAIAEKSLSFENVLATGTRTVRGIEALTLSLPPTPGSSIVRRPGNEGLFNIGTLYRARGYDTAFIYGGFGYFDNMNAFFSGNGFRVVDRAVMPAELKTFSNIWGVCDENLLDAALGEADATYASGKPFYQFIMTTSNHRPFTYPEGKVAIPSGTNRRGAIQYTDYAIGRFLREAEKRPWFRNTVFVIVADHTAGSAGYTDLPPERYRIPCLIYSPEHIQPQKINTLCSQVDIAPTLFALLGWSYQSSFFGKNVLPMKPEDGRAWIGTYQILGRVTPKGLAILEPKKPARLEFANGDGGQALVNATIAGYQTAQDLFTKGLLREDLSPTENVLLPLFEQLGGEKISSAFTKMQEHLCLTGKKLRQAFTKS